MRFPFQSLRGVWGDWSGRQIELLEAQLEFQSLRGVWGDWSAQGDGSLIVVPVFQSLRGVWGDWSQALAVSNIGSSEFQSLRGVWGGWSKEDLRSHACQNCVSIPERGLGWLEPAARTGAMTNTTRFNP